MLEIKNPYGRDPRELWGDDCGNNTWTWKEKIVPERKTVKVKRLSDQAFIPTYGHLGDAGMDFYLPDDVMISPGETKVKIPLGIAVEIPHGYFLGIVLRSSTGLKSTARLSNQFGVIDEGYRGELALILDNISDTEWVQFKRGDRIAQGLLIEKPMVEIQEVEELSDTERGEGGFGSTGK